VGRNPSLESFRVDVASAEYHRDVAVAFERNLSCQQCGDRDCSGWFGAEPVLIFHPLHRLARFIIGNGNRFPHMLMENRPIVFAHIIGKESVTNAGRMFDAHALARR